MANIKFSQFTVGNTESDIDFVVGYKGGDNIQISPANLLSATLTGYLPLTGGTMTGNVKFNDNIELRLGAGADLKAYHSGTHTYFDNNVGDLVFRNLANDKDILFQSDDGSGGIATYFMLDGGAEIVVASKEFRFLDNVPVKLGTGPDFQMLHNGTSTSIENSTGNLLITNFADDSDIIFKSDDGTGGVTEYFRLDGSIVRNVFSKNVGLEDNVQLIIGSGNDLKILHDGSDSVIQNDTGNLEIQNRQNDGDIVFKSDDGSGGVAEYFKLDGSRADGNYTYTTRPDGGVITFGDSLDLRIWHDPSTNFSYIRSYNNDLYIESDSANRDILFRANDGGGTATYFVVDGSATQTRFYKDTRHADNIKANFGNNDDLEIYHDGSNSFIRNTNTNLIIKNEYNDGDIIFESDDGSGNIAEYFRVDGGITRTIFSKDTRHDDGVKAFFGSGYDLEIYHNGSDSYVSNDTGDLYIRNSANDKDIHFQTDDGSGGVATYFLLDGSMADGTNRFTKFGDNSWITMGDGGDLLIGHQTTSSKIENYTGPLYIVNKADDQDIIFETDNGAGGTVEYLRLDGSTTKIQVNKEMQFFDNVKATFGFAADLQIYHDGSNSFIDESGTGNLYIRSATNMFFHTYGSGKRWITLTENAGVELFYNDSKKLETTSTGIKISGVSEYADNTAAIAGGLTTGDVYRTGDLLKIVH
jgi:trimeric autotransporter adhesin